jgi:hypothetical protein
MNAIGKAATIVDAIQSWYTSKSIQRHGIIFTKYLDTLPSSYSSIPDPLKKKHQDKIFVQLLSQITPQCQIKQALPL